jgi:cytochrome c553
MLTTVDTDTPSDAAPSGEAGAPGEAFSPGNEVAHSAMSFSSSFLLGAGPLDVAFDAQSSRVATIALDDRLTTVSMRNAGLNSVDATALDPAANLWWSPWGSSMITAVRIPGQPVSVAFAAGKYIVQSREPATLSFEDGTSVALSDESHADSGHQMFNMNSGIGIACASCHPEGGDDGHIWRFPEGLRRTMPLEGGVLERAPFHWDGTLADMGTLVNAVMVTRMGLAELPSEPQIEALGAFLEQLPNLPPADDLDAAAVKRGEGIFRRSDVACASCHSGPQFTNNQLADVGTGGSFVTPTLLGVGLRPALFHDGCAKSVVQRFGVCGGTAHGKPELLSADERLDLIAFLRSL